MNVYYKRWSDYKVALLTEKHNGDVYKEVPIEKGMTHKQIKKKIILNHEMTANDRLCEVK